MAYFVGAYWGAREESQRECAVRVAAFLEALARDGIGLSQWYKKAKSRKAPLVLLPKDAEGLEPLLSVHLRDLDGEVVADLGFSFAAWTGPEAKAVGSLSVECGAYCSVVGMISNAVVVSFEPSPSPTMEFLQEILRAAVSAFDPEDAVVNSSERLSQYSLPVTEAPAIYRYKRGSGFSQSEML
jgi:hypothetical protein